MSVGALVSIAAVFISWLVSVLIFAYKIGRFQETAATKAELNLVAKEASSSLTLAIKDTSAAIDKVETGIRDEIKDTRKTIEARLDGIFKEIVRK